MAGQDIIHLAPPVDRVPHLMQDLFQWLQATDHHPLLASTVFIEFLLKMIFAAIKDLPTPEAAWDNCKNPDATKLLITSDGGRSNGCWVCLMKVALQKFANETGLPISVWLAFSDRQFFLDLK